MTADGTKGVRDEAHTPSPLGSFHTEAVAPDGQPVSAGLGRVGVAYAVFGYCIRAKGGVGQREQWQGRRRILLHFIESICSVYYGSSPAVTSGWERH